MYHDVKKQQSLFVFAFLLGACFVEGMDPKGATQTRDQSQGFTFLKNMKNTVDAAKEQKYQRKDKPIRQDVAYLDRVVRNSKYDNKENVSPVAPKEKKQPKKRQSKAVRLAAMYKERNEVFAAADEFPLLEEFIDKDFTNGCMSKQKPLPVTKGRAVVQKPVSLPITTTNEDFSVQQPQDQDVNPKKRKRRDERVFSTKRPAATRNADDADERITQRAKEVAKNPGLSGGTWDYRNEKTFANELNK